MGNSVTADLLLIIAHCWCACKVDEEKQDLNMVLYCTHMI